MISEAVAATASQTATPGLLRTIITRITFANLVMIAAIFASAGRLDWGMGWATLIVAGLDQRHGWTSPWPLAAQVAALAFTALGLFLVSRAMLANRFFSAVIRIQTDRGHHVVSSGPYRVVRHPGYAGGLMYWMPVPVALGSMWALIPSALFLAVTVIRTTLEDRTLGRELPGYSEYAERVRYRLIPGVW